MRMPVRYLPYLVILLALLGCSQANTTGSVTERDYNIRISNQGELWIYMPLDVAAKTEASPEQSTDNDPTTRNNANSSLAGQGATATGAVGEAVKQALDGVESVSRRLLDQRKENADNTTTVNEAPAPAPKPETEQEVKPSPKPQPDEQVQADPGAPEGFSLSSVRWLHTDVSNWPVTGHLKSVGVSGNKITLDYDKARTWPGVGEKSINANPWIFVHKDGKWYAATWEWLRFGQRTKALYAVSGSHIKRDPLRDFEPQPGELYGFMVSGLARDMAHFKNVQERTNIYWMRWPK